MAEATVAPLTSITPLVIADKTIALVEETEEAEAEAVVTIVPAMTTSAAAEAAEGSLPRHTR